MARAVPGAFWDRDAKAWLLASPTPRGATVALKMFPELAVKHPELEQLRDSVLGDVRPFDNATPYDRWIGDVLEARDEQWVTAALDEAGQSFYKFQNLDLGYIADVLREHGGAYLGWERGLGKTLGTCALIEELNCKRTLVVAPNTAKDSVWRAELTRFLPDHEVFVLPNTKSKRERMLSWIGRTATTPFVLVVHYEALTIIGGKDGRGWKKYGEWDLVVADEAHRLKNPSTKMARAIKKIPTKMKLALSGSIIQNHVEELFSPLQWLFPDNYKSKWRDWNDRYLDYVDGGYGRICVGVKPERIEDMREELGAFMVYRRKEDELDLPPKTEQTLYVDLSPGQRRAYNELADTCLTQLSDGSVVKAADGLVMLTRLRQVATGLSLVGHEVDDSSKIDLAVELIQDSEDEAFVVFSWFKAAAHTLAKRLSGTECFVVDGDVKQDVRADFIDRFQAGERRVFIGTLSTLGESVNLQRASNAIFLDRSWNPAANVQAADRIYRIGQDKPVTITQIVARNTVDEFNVMPTLANKEALRALILGGH
jgi:SNF2 family DNA or RNA helicase